MRSGNGFTRGLAPVTMSRVAVVAPVERLRSVLVAVAADGGVELDTAPEEHGGEAMEALRRLAPAAAARDLAPRLAASPPDLEELERAGRSDLLAGEAELLQRASAAVTRRSVVAAAGWMADAGVEALAVRLAPLGGAVIRLPRPAWAIPPTRLPEHRGATSFQLLVGTYGTSRYEDLDPTPFAAVSFVLMFGMMFGDLGHGLILALLSLAARFAPWRRLAWVRRIWLLPFAAGLAAAAFGLLYGEAFGPTGLVPALWLRPLESPVTLLVTGVAAGCGLLAISYVVGTVNRWREGGARAAVLAGAGLAGLLAFGGACAAVVGLALLHLTWLAWAAGAVAAGGLALVFVGLLLDAPRGAIGLLQSVIELFDTIVRLGSNAVSFARLAAFGLVHAAIGGVVWSATSALWGRGLATLAAIGLFAVGNALAFGLEGLVAGVQALRLEYYELFSRIFAGEGRPFRPWHLEEEA